MPSVEVWIDSSDVLESMDDDEIVREYEARMKKKGAVVVPLADLFEQIAIDYRNKDATPALRELIYRETGKII